MKLMETEDYVARLVVGAFAMIVAIALIVLLLALPLLNREMMKKACERSLHAAETTQTVPSNTSK